MHETKAFWVTLLLMIDVATLSRYTPDFDLSSITFWLLAAFMSIGVPLAFASWLDLAKRVARTDRCQYGWALRNGANVGDVVTVSGSRYPVGVVREVTDDQAYVQSFPSWLL